jgi:hypothetical protein
MLKHDSPLGGARCGSDMVSHSGRLASALEIAGGHTFPILKREWSANFIMVWCVLLRPLRPELDGQDADVV